MIRLFLSSDRDYSNNGEINIQATRAIVYKTDNGDFYLDLTCGLEYQEYIKAQNIIVVPTPQGSQAFRIKNYEKTRTKITLKAYHIFYDSQNYLIADSYVVNKNCNDALDHLNTATDTPSPFTTLSDVATVDSYRCVRKSLYEAISEVLNRWGGHLVRDNYNIQIRQSIGVDNGAFIQYGKNLKDISVIENWGDVCTKLLPVGKDGFTLDYIYSSVQYDQPFTKTLSFEQEINREDYSSDDQYTAALREDLRQKALKYLESAQYPAITYTLAANMDAITDIGDTVKVFDDRLGITLETSVLSFEYDCILERYVSVSFGTKPASLGELVNTVTSAIDYSINENNQVISVTLSNALQDAKSEIFTALTSSYVIYEGNQILIVDNLPANTAHNVIRIDSAGIGFSNTGISGDFVTAWTIDGTFNAQAINVINLTADMIKGGTLKLGSNLNQYGLLEIYDEANNLISTLDKNGLKMYGLNGSYIVANSEVGFAGYDANDNLTFWVNEDEFHQKKAVVEEEITLSGKIRFIPIEIYDGDTLTTDGVGVVTTT